jgi:hypothetical protein
MPPEDSLMLAFFKGKSFFSRLIKWRTWGVYSHVGWVEPDGVIYESWHRKDLITGHNGPRRGMIGDLHKPGTQVDLFSVQLYPDQHRALITELQSCVERGVRYDFKGVFGGFVLRRAQSETDNFMFCSDYMMHAFKTAGHPLLNQVPTWQVSPSELSHSPLIRPAGGFLTGEEWSAPKLEWGNY